MVVFIALGFFWEFKEKKGEREISWNKMDWIIKFCNVWLTVYMYEGILSWLIKIVLKKNMFKIFTITTLIMLVVVGAIQDCANADAIECASSICSGHYYTSNTCTKNGSAT